jgi:hypothetical protein
MINSTHLNEAH